MGRDLASRHRPATATLPAGPPGVPRATAEAAVSIPRVETKGSSTWRGPSPCTGLGGAVLRGRGGSRGGQVKARQSRKKVSTETGRNKQSKYIQVADRESKRDRGARSEERPYAGIEAGRLGQPAPR